MLRPSEAVTSTESCNSMVALTKRSEREAAPAPAGGPVQDPEPLVGRPLDGFEATWGLSEQMMRLNVLVGARVRGPLHPGIVRRALDAIQRRHALLRVHIEGAPKDLRWVEGVPQLPLLVVARRDDATWQEASARAVDVPLDLRKGPLAHAVFVQGEDVHELMFTFHHVIGDGDSGFRLMGDFIGACAAYLDGREPDLPPLPLPPPLHDLSPMKLEDPATKRAVRRQLVRWLPLFIPPTVQLRTDAKTGEGGPRTQVHHRALTVEETTALAKRCRAQGTTVTGVLTAAFLLSIADDHGKPAKYGMVVPVNLRAHMPPLSPEAAASLAFYSLAFYLAARVRPGENLWALATKLRRRIAEEQARGAHWISVAFYEAAARRLQERSRITKVAGGSRRTALVCTNVGRLEAPPQVGKLRWEGYTSVVGLEWSAATFMCAIMTFNGQLTFNLVHPTPAVAPGRGARVADAIHQRLRV